MKTRFCWNCSRKFRGNHYVKIIVRTPSDGTFFFAWVHKSCVNETVKSSDGIVLRAEREGV